MANAYFYSNTAQQTTLSGSISSAAATVQVAATTGFPPSTPYILAVDYGAATEELIKVTGVAGTTLTVTRGFGSTSAQSHSLGAIVRHVVNAVDLTDFRTHEASTGAVHGLAGSIVGTSDTQTLSNKTFSGGALSGTFTGSPTYSGLATHTGFIQSLRTNATDSAFGVGVTGDTINRFNVDQGGQLTWGPGGATLRDVNLYRSQAGELKTDDALAVAGELRLSNLTRGSRASSGDSQYETRITGDATARWFVWAGGTHWWGDGTNVADTRLYRDAPGSLTTNGDFVVGGELSVVGSTTWTTYTPTVTGAGTASWNNRTGYYYKIGKVVFVCILLEANGAGSGSSILNVGLPSTPDRTLRQALTLHAETVGVAGTGAKTIRGGEAVVFGGGSGAVTDRLRVVDSDGDGSNNLQGQDLISGSLITVQGWYREA